MNAAANSHLRELQKSLTIAFLESKVTFDRGTYQQSADNRARVLADRPNNLLTNSVVLEFVLTRPRGHGLVEAARACSSWFWTTCTPNRLQESN